MCRIEHATGYRNVAFVVRALSYIETMVAGEIKTKPLVIVKTIRLPVSHGTRKRCRIHFVSVATERKLRIIILDTFLRRRCIRETSYGTSTKIDDS